MASFAKNITTPIDIPTVQAPNFNSNTSTVQDVATLASFGLAINDRVEAKDKEQQRQAIEQDASLFVDKLVTQTLENAQQPGGMSKALQSAQLAISARGTPLQSSFINTEFSKRIASAQQGVSQTTPKLSDAFSIADKGLQSTALAALGFNNTPTFGTQERDALNTEVNKVVSVKIAYDTNKKEAEHAGNVSSAQLSTLSSSAQKVLSTQFRPMITQMTKLLEDSASLPSGEHASVIDGLHGNVAMLKGVATDFVDSTYAGVDASKSKVHREQLLAQVNRLFAPFETADEEALGKSAKFLNFLSNDMKMGALNAGDTLALVKAKYGKDLPEVTWNFIINNAKSPLVQDLEGAVETTFGFFTPEQKAAFTMQSLHDYVNGGGSVDDIGNSLLTQKQKDNMYEQGFKFLKAHTRDGVLLNLNTEDVNRAGDAMINVLQDSSSTDTGTSDSIMSWAEDPNFQSVLGKINSKKADAIRNMIISKSKQVARAGDGDLANINKHPEFYTFDIASNKFVLTSSGEDLPSRTGSGVLAGAGDTSKRQATTYVKKANRDVETFLANADSNPALAGLNKQQKLDWFLNQGAGVPMSTDLQVTGGKFQDLSKDESAAVDAGMSVEDFKKQREAIDNRANLPSQVLELQQQIRDLRDKGVQKPAPVSFSDMTDEEFKQLIADEKKRRANTGGAAKPAGVVKRDGSSGDSKFGRGFGKREDGSNKQNGFFGVLKRPDGFVSTELSERGGVFVDGKEKELLYPLIVPTLTKEELNTLLNGGYSEEISNKARAFAKKRVEAGKSPFWEPGEKVYARP